MSVVCLLTALSGCTAQAAPENSSSRGDAPAGQSSVAPARQGRPAASQRIEFIPERLTLPGHATAGVLPAVTVDGVLRVPEDVEHVGWWDGSARVGEPFGSTVIAGHVDSATEGIGFFARLLKIKAGDTITLRADSHQLKYRVTSVRTVAKKALATDSQAFRQTGRHRLVLITCTGNFHRDRGGYDSNLVVVGKPLGVAR
ncbi:MAG TPA: class F sortase [Propionibacteriaceae bacterium]|nr:class F sortase [Propionibacteriaceae bacterium]